MFKVSPTFVMIYVIVAMNLTCATVRSGYNGIRFKDANLAPAVGHEVNINAGLINNPEEQDCVKHCRSIATSTNSNIQIAWTTLRAYPLFMCHYHSNDKKCHMTGAYEDDTNVQEQTHYGYLQQASGVVTYVNIIPDGLDPQNQAVNEKTGWYWGVKCKGSSPYVNAQNKANLNESFDHLNSFADVSGNLGNKCVQFEKGNSGSQSIVYDNCQGIEEDSTTSAFFCYIFDSSVVPDTPVGEANQAFEEYGGEQENGYKCGSAFQSGNGAIVQSLAANNHQLCKDACLNFKLNSQYFEKNIYCCEFHEQSQTCNIFGTDDSSMTTTETKEQNQNGLYIAYVDIVPRNLKKWHKGATRMAACQGGSSTTNFQNIVDISACQQVQNVMSWFKAQPKHLNYCVRYSGSTNDCIYLESCQSVLTPGGDREFCLVSRSVQCTITNSHPDPIEINQGSCAEINQFSRTSLCSNEAIQYSLTDDQHLNLTDWYLYKDYQSSDETKLGKLHICPKNLRSAQNITVKIHASVASQNVQESITFQITPNGDKQDGHHGNQGWRQENASCYNPGPSSVWFQSLVVFHQINMKPDNEQKCLQQCLEWWPDDYSQSRSLYCCRYEASNRNCELYGHDLIYQSRQVSKNNDTGMTTYFGVIPEILNPSLHRGGWRWDAYCSGTFHYAIFTSSLSNCRDLFMADYRGQVSNSCAQYQGDTQICTIFADCDSEVGNLDGFFCYNPMYAEVIGESPKAPSISAPQNLSPKQFFVNETQAVYQFPKFTCTDCKAEVIYALNMTSSSLNSSEINSILSLDSNSSSSDMIKIIVNTSKEANVSFSAYGYLNNSNDVNATSNSVQISIVIKRDEKSIPEKQQTFNFAPQFVSELPQEVLVDDLFPQNEGFVFALPQIYDTENDQFSKAVIGLNETFSSFDEESNELRFFNLSDSRNLTVEIKLKDSQGKSSSHIIKFIFEIQSVIEPQETEEEQMTSTFAGVDVDLVDRQRKESQESNEQEEEIPEFNCQIKSISDQGEVFILFSEKVEQFDKTFINESSLLIKVQPSSTKTQEQLEKMKLSWHVLQFYEDRLYLQVKFENPLFISSSFDQDSLLINFKNASSLFKADKTKMALKPDYSIKRKIRPQNIDTQAAKNFAVATEEAAGYMNKSFWLIYFVTLIASSNRVGLVYIQLINAHQMFVYLPITNFRHPANAMALITSIQPIAQFDPLDGFENSKLSLEEMDIWDKDDDQFEAQGFSDQMKDLEFESLNSILNLGSLAFFLNIYIIKLIFFIFLKYTVVRKYGWFKETVDAQLRSAKFNEIILLTIESSQDMFVAGYLQSLKTTVSWYFFGDAMSMVLGIICLILICLIPILYVYILCQSQEKIESELFKSRFGAFYDSVKTRNFYTISYSMIFVLRRTIFCIALFAIESPACQFMLIYLNNLAYSIYFFYHMPKQIPSLQYLEMFNEVMINIITLHLVPFSDFGPDAETQSDFGFSMCACICMMQLVNVIGCIYFLVRDLRLVFIRHYRRLPLYKRKLIFEALGYLFKSFSDAEKQMLTGVKIPSQQQQDSSSSSSSDSSEESKSQPLQAPRNLEICFDEVEPPIPCVLNQVDALADVQLEIKVNNVDLNEEIPPELPTKQAQEAEQFFKEAKSDDLVQVKTKNKVSFNQWKEKLGKKPKTLKRIQNLAKRYSLKVDEIQGSNLDKIQEESSNRKNDRNKSGRSSGSITEILDDIEQARAKKVDSIDNLE